MQKLSGLAAATVIGFGAAMAAACPQPVERGDNVVYVRSQNLYFDTIVLGSLPPQGPVQLLEMGPNGLETDYGPGNPGYLGGRWMEDFDGDGEFNYFLCPLLGPGRPNP